jgi:GT2 family glycosyltransferase
VTPALSILIPARNAAAHLGRCLEAVLEQSSDDVEVTVIDDASTDKTAAVARAHGVRVITLPKRKRSSGARNMGASVARGEVLVFLDSDDIPQTGWLDAIRSAFEKGADHIRCKIDIQPSSRTAARFIDHEWNASPKWQPDWPGGLPKPTNSIAIRKELMEVIGGFDESLHACEDQDFQLRAALCGFPAIEIPTARVAMGRRTSFGDLLLQRGRWNYWAPFIRSKYREFPFAFPPRRDHLRGIAVALAVTGRAVTKGDRERAQWSLLEAGQIAAMGAGFFVGRIALAMRRGGPPAVGPRGEERLVVGGALPAGPLAVLTGDRRWVWTWARAINTDKSISCAPSSLLPETVETWGEPPPSASSLVDLASRSGWRLPRSLATLRLASASPESHLEAVLTLHAEFAWLTNHPRWVLPAPGATGEIFSSRFPEIPVIEVDGATSIAEVSEALALWAPDRVSSTYKLMKLTMRLRRALP